MESNIQKEPFFLKLYIGARKIKRKSAFFGGLGFFRGRENEQQRGIWLLRVSHDSRWQRRLSAPVWHFGESLWLAGKWNEHSSFPEIISQDFIFTLFPSVLWHGLHWGNPEISKAAFVDAEACNHSLAPLGRSDSKRFISYRSLSRLLALVTSSLLPSHRHCAWKYPLWAAGSSGWEGASAKPGYFSRKRQLPASFVVREGKSLLCWKKWTYTNKLAQQLFSYPSEGINCLAFIPSRCLFLVWFLIMNLKTRTHLHVANSKYRRSLQG